MKYDVEVTLVETYAIYQVEAGSTEEARVKAYEAIAEEQQPISGPHSWELDHPRIDNVDEVK